MSKRLLESALYAFGLSLGSYMMETPFGGDVDMANRTDEILLAGSPPSTR